MHQVSHALARSPHREQTRLGVWAFLAGEIMLFGGLFTAYTIYRLSHAEAFAEASEHLYQSIGITNTAILLLSSLSMAIAVHAARADARRLTSRLLVATALLGAVFLTLKGIEYALDFREHIVPGPSFDATPFTEPDGARLFFVLYFIMTGMHTVHMIVAVGVVLVSARMARPGGTLSAEAVEGVALFWHFVDLVWVFLLPVLYLIA